MNILFICDEYPPGPNGGVGTSVQLLSRELVKQGHNVFVTGLYSYSFGGEDYEEDQGVKVWRYRYGLDLKLNGGHIIHKFYNKIPGFLKRQLNGWSAFQSFITSMHTLIKNETIEIIEVPDWNTFAMRIGFSVQWPDFGVPLLLKSHGSYTYFAHEMREPAKSWLVEIDNALVKRADALSAVSIYTAEQNKKIFDIKREIKVLYNGIELPNTKPAEIREKGKVIFTGTLIAKKGVFQLMKAWNLVNSKYPEVVLEVYGKGNINALKNILTEKAAETVYFKGHVKRLELLQVLSSATMAIFPSYSECFALAPMEAMSVGCPVIYTSRSSGKELIQDHQNGTLVDPDNIQAIANSIIELIENTFLQEQYSRLGISTIREKFSISKIAHDHLLYYDHIIKTYNS